MEYPKPYEASGWAAFGATVALVLSGMGLGAAASAVYGTLHSRGWPLGGTLFLTTASAGFTIVATVVCSQVADWAKAGDMPCTPREWQQLLERNSDAKRCSGSEYEGWSIYLGSLLIKAAVLMIVGFVLHATKRLGRAEVAAAAKDDGAGTDDVAAKGSGAVEEVSAERVPDIEKRLRALESLVERLAKRERMELGVDGTPTDGGLTTKTRME